MANALSANVWRIDTSGDLNGVQDICGVKLIGGGASATLSITKKGSSTVIYQAQANSSSETWNPDAEFRSPVGLTITITGTGAVAYLYRK